MYIWLPDDQCYMAADYTESGEELLICYTLFFYEASMFVKVCEFQLYIYTLSSVDIRHSTLKMFV